MSKTLRSLRVDAQARCSIGYATTHLYGSHIARAALGDRRANEHYSPRATI